MGNPKHNGRILALLLGFSAFVFQGHLPLLSSAPLVAEEICANAIDDDGDGLIDLNDPDCTCELIEPVSLIPNPSFEDLSCCPNNRSQLDCATGWIQASEPTTDFLHMCGWMGWADFPPPLPFPDGEGAMGFRDGRVRQSVSPERDWKEYAGACLLGPLLADNLYRFEFYVGFVSTVKSPPVNITFFGTPDCVNLPFGIGNEAFGCPSNDPKWVKLGSTLVSGGPGNRWVKARIEVTPEETINAIAIGPDCAPTMSSQSTFYFFDNLILADFRSFEFRITSVSHPCADDFSLRVPENADYSYQWYKDGIALVGETSSRVTANYGEGAYQVTIRDSLNCWVTKAFNHSIPVFSSSFQKTICQEDVYLLGSQQLSETGIYTETFKSKNNCDSIVTLELEVLGDLADTVTARIFEGETYQIHTYRFEKKGEYLLTLTSSLGCDSLVLLQLDYFQIFIPNVFTPNQDNINDLFRVYTESGLVEHAELTIYDRWGTVLYSGPEWNGKFKDEFVQPGVYTYLARIAMSDGGERRFSGSVTVLR